ncbi:MAG: preprotein translocase subunit SecG [Gammaproteobacteria bacterium]|nr:MAG: preprotein translocase subunit SecG [Gammaproteobacteria bacterium]
MENINSILTIAQVLLSIALIGLILMQHGKGADAGAAFGSGASASVFGARGSGNFLSKTTGVLATLFFIVCLSLAYVTSNRQITDSISDSVTTIESEQQLPATMENSDLPPVEGSSDTSVDSDLPPAN